MASQKAKLSETERPEALEGMSLLSSVEFASRDENSSLEHENFWKAAFDAMLEPAWLTNAEGLIQQANRAARKLFGDDMVGRHCWETACGVKKPAAGCPCSQLHQSGRREADEVPIGDRWFSCTVDPLFDSSEKICGAIYVLRDITERRRADELLIESWGRYRTLFDRANDGIFILSGKGELLSVNESFARMHGYTPQEMLHMHLKDLDTPESLREAPARIQRLLAGEPLTFEVQHYHKDGHVLPLEVSCSLITSGKKSFIQCFHRDITERKQSEHLLRRANHTLQAIRDCHEAMLRANTERDLLQEICRIIVQTGGERMAWVGFAEHDVKKTVRPVVVEGCEDYVKNARITWSDTPRGRGPVGAAIRTQKVSICQNTLTDPSFAPWREDARSLGYGSMIALPLMMNGQCLGALCIYAPEPDAFDSAEQLLFTDLANDLAYGISTLRLRVERERLESEAMKSIEREQERIGRDLHDGLCQMLVGAKFRSGYLGKITKNHLPEAEKEARGLEDMLNQAIEQARDLARGLNPVKVTPAGLAAALKKFAEDVQSLGGPHCFCHFTGRARIMDHHTANHLYRIAQEAVQNAIKHAKAKNISITLAKQDGNITLTVKDDGVGIPDRIPKSGMGMSNMKMRARLVGGQFEIRRRSRAGTAMTVRLPVSKIGNPNENLQSKDAKAP